MSSDIQERVGRDANMAKDRNGLYIQPDYWLAVEHLPKGQQDKALGAMVRLFFTGEDIPPSSGGARSAYFGVRERIIGARNKSKKPDEEEAENGTGNGQETDSKRTANSDFPSKEGEGDSIYLSGEEESLPEEDQPGTLPRYEEIDSKFAAEALAVFTEETGKQCLMPERRVLNYLTRIHERGCTIEDVRLVCKDRQKLWGKDPQFSQHIWPDTLFAPSHFDKYLASAKSNPEVKIDAEAAEFAGAF